MLFLPGFFIVSTCSDPWQDVALIQEALPLLMCAAAAVGDTSKLTHLMGMVC